MNKTLLIILVDFLLLTILSLTEWDKEREESKPPPSDAGVPESVSAMAMMEKDLLDTLQSSLEEERVEQEDLAMTAEEKARELEEVERQLRERENSISSLESNLTEAERKALELAREKEALVTEVASKEQGIENLQELYSDVEAKARQSEAQSRRLQQELDQKLGEIEEKEKALAVAAEEQRAAAARIQELDVKVQVAENEKSFLTNRVTELSQEVEVEREEKKVIREQAGKLAEGVTQLAEQSQDLREELRSSIPINANQLFSQFMGKQVEATFRSLRVVRSRASEIVDTSRSILVSDGVDTFALFHIDQTPFSLGQSVSLLKGAKGKIDLRPGSMLVDEVNFLSVDPRVAVVPIDKEKAERAKSSVYLTALDPFKFPEAVLISGSSGKYGGVEFKLDADTPGYVRMQSKILSSLFGEFSPSEGDLVLSMTGELLGIMVNRRYCVLIDNFVVSQSVGLSEEYNPRELERALESLRRQYEALGDDVD